MFKDDNLLILYRLDIICKVISLTYFITLYYSSGNVVNGPIGKQMVETLVESSGNFEVSFFKNAASMIYLK